MNNLIIGTNTTNITIKPMDYIEFDYDGSIRTVTRKGVQIWPQPAPAPQNTDTDTNESKQGTTERKQQ
jgi:hypothetical protein